MTNSGFEYVIDRSAYCFFVKHYGVFDRQVVLDGNKVNAGDEDYAWDLNRLIDIRNCSIELTSDEVRDLSRNVTSRLEGKGTYRGAYLVDNSLAHGLARIFNALVENNVSEYRIFHAGDKTLASDLRDWLDLDHEYAFPDFLTLN